jgi:hypothetical protein
MAEIDQNPAVEHEESDVNIRAIFGFGLGLLAVGVVIHVLVWLLFISFTAGEQVHAPPQYPLAAADAERLPPEPRLQTAPRQDLIDLRTQEQQLLRTYGWVDRNAGVVRIPIEEAIRLTLERGLPVRPTPKGKQ